MKSSKKLVKVHMLPSKSQIFQLDTGDMFISDSREHSWGKLEYLICERVTSHGHAWNGRGISSYINYLYFTSDEEIKEGDWFIRNVGSILAVEQYIKDDHLYAKDRKIVATTDKSLKISVVPGFNGFIKSLPQISQQFQKEYVKAGGIDEVLVDYETNYINWKHDDKIEALIDTLEPKTDSNNCLIIHPVEPKLYTRENVEELLAKYWYENEYDAINSKDTDKASKSREAFDNWIKENL
jgi:hypothetical protein